MKVDLFKEILPSIMHTHQPVITEGNEKDYPPFMVNRALSYHSDCVLRANQMNLNHGLDKLLQYQYLLHTIRPYKRRYVPWPKKEDIDGLDAVMEHYNYSYDKAKEAMFLLSKDDIEKIKLETRKGGATKNTKY